MSDGLKDPHRQALIDLLSAHPRVERVVLFGSRAMGTFTPTSDVDIALYGAELTLGDQAELAEAVDELPMAQKVDLVLYGTITSEELLAHIEEHGMEWDKKGKEINPNPYMSNLYQPYFQSYWPPYQLYDLAEWVNGMTFKNSHFASSGKPVIKIAEIKNGITGQTKFSEEDYDKAYLIENGSMVFSWSGQPETSIDVFRWRGGPGWLNQHIFKILTKDECLDIYLYYLLKYLKPNFIQIARNKQTTGLGHVTKKDLQAITVRIPHSKDTQRAIAHILGTLDAKIELNRQMNQTLEQIAQAIFKSWFVDFELVVRNAAKMGKPVPERFIAAASFYKANSQNHELSLPDEIVDLFPYSFEESEIGVIPKGWGAGTLQDFSKLNASTWTKKNLPDEIHYVDLANTKDGFITSIQVHQKDSAPSRARRVLNPGDTIVGTVRPGNRSFALIGESPIRLTGSTGFAVLTPTEKNNREYVYLHATSADNINCLARLADGAAYPAVRPNVVADTACVIPPYDLIVHFHEITGPLFDRIDDNHHDSRSLGNVRDTLLPKLISGELSISDADKILADVA